MLQHGAIYLQQEIGINFDLTIGSNPQETSVIEGMVNFSQGNGIRDDGFPVGLRGELLTLNSLRLYVER